MQYVYDQFPKMNINIMYCKHTLIKKIKAFNCISNVWDLFLWISCLMHYIQKHTLFSRLLELFVICLKSPLIGNLNIAIAAVFHMSFFTFNFSMSLMFQIHFCKYQMDVLLFKIHHDIPYLNLIFSSFTLVSVKYLFYWN